MEGRVTLNGCQWIDDWQWDRLSSFESFTRLESFITLWCGVSFNYIRDISKACVCLVWHVHCGAWFFIYLFIVQTCCKEKWVKCPRTFTSHVYLENTHFEG